MTRLRTVSPDRPGIARKRSGRGFTYVRPDGHRASANERKRIDDLVIPPAWTDVWICTVPNGHIQAVGTDDAGRRQYLYHPAWREQRDRLKFDHAVAVGQRLPAARRTVSRHIALPDMPRERALATAFRLLDLGLFRIGGETYAQEHQSYGLATLLRRHVTLARPSMTFRYAAKSGQRREVEVVDAQAASAIAALLRRRARGGELLAYRDGRHWRDVTSTDINEYVKERLGDDVSAKDFRTWHATVLAAAELAAHDDQLTSRTAADRVVRDMVRTVAELLGNTPAVARKSYIDPEVIECFRRGVTIDTRVPAERLLSHPASRSRAERATRRLLTDN